MDLCSKVLKTSKDGIHTICMIHYPLSEKLLHIVQTQPTKLKFVTLSNTAEKSSALSSCNYSSSNCRLQLGCFLASSLPDCASLFPLPLLGDYGLQSLCHHGRHLPDLLQCYNIHFKMEESPTGYGYKLSCSKRKLAKQQI